MSVTVPRSVDTAARKILLNTNPQGHHHLHYHRHPCLWHICYQGSNQCCLDQLYVQRWATYKGGPRLNPASCSHKLSQFFSKGTLKKFFYQPCIHTTQKIQFRAGHGYHSRSRQRRLRWTCTSRSARRRRRRRPQRCSQDIWGRRETIRGLK